MGATPSMDARIKYPMAQDNPDSVGCRWPTLLVADGFQKQLASDHFPELPDAQDVGLWILCNTLLTVSFMVGRMVGQLFQERKKPL